MSLRIPENILDDILSRVDIVEIVSGFIPLKRAGRNFRALCPFHQEKTPSFMVSSDRQIYHCFGCGKGGNVFNFLMEYERLEFLEVVEALAKKVGTIRGKKVSPQCNLAVKKMYNGIMVTWNGSIMVLKTRMKIRSRPGQRMRANP
jgi:DNA primase